MYLAPAIGVTRIARLTALDRTGVEVASAMRPSGHVLQVSNGKGRDFEAAARGALHEAAELWAAEQPLGVATVEARRLDAPGTITVSAYAITCPPVGLGPVDAEWTSNGMGAHPRLSGALRHALFEAWEREALARVLPEGWQPRDFAGRRLGPVALAEGFEVEAFDLTPKGAAAPVAGALLRDRDGGPIPLTAGYASRATLRDAVEAAVLEAAQSRQTEIQAAREDVVVARALDVGALWKEVRRARVSSRAQVRGPSSARALAKRFGRPVAYVELVPGRLPIRVVKVVVPGFRVSELLQ